MKLYLSGPMTGRPDFNYPAFNAAAAHLRALGHDVFNPAESFDGDTSRPLADYMRADIAAILECEAIALLPDWRSSGGVRLELDIAMILNLPIYEYGDGSGLRSWPPSIAEAA